MTRTKSKNKICTKCNALKPLRDFPKEARTYDGKEGLYEYVFPEED